MVIFHSYFDITRGYQLYHIRLLQASMEGVANASAWLEEEASSDMDGKHGYDLTV
jgi:hypothetical protein